MRPPTEDEVVDAFATFFLAVMAALFFGSAILQIVLMG